MHYYTFNIGDYARRTRHLTAIEDLAYRRMLDLYYSKESAFPDDIKKLARLLGLNDYIDEVSNVLSDFFSLQNGFWQHSRMNEEIKKYQLKAEVSRRNGSKGGRPKTHQVKNKTQEKADRKATNNHKPITNNQEPDLKTNVVLEIFNFWKTTMKKGAQTKASGTRIKKITTRLKEGYTIEQIKQAIINNKNSPYHQGQNDNGTKYDDIELICRNPVKLDMFINMSSNNDDNAFNEWAGDD